MALDFLSSSISLNWQWKAQRTREGDFKPIENKDQILHQIALGTDDTSATEMYSALTIISGSATTAINCHIPSDGNVLGEGTTYTHFSAFMVRLLSPSQDSTNGTVAGSVELSSNFAGLNFSAVELQNGQVFFISGSFNNASSVATLTVHNLSTTPACIELTYIGKSV